PRARGRKPVFARTRIHSRSNVRARSHSRRHLTITQIAISTPPSLLRYEKGQGRQILLGLASFPKTALLQSDHVNPPAARIDSPVSHPDSSDARNTASGAMSCGWPALPNGVLATTFFSISDPTKLAVCTPSVIVNP